MKALRPRCIVLALLFFAIAHQASAIVYLNVAGGIDSPLTVTITQGDSFSATAAHSSGGLYLVFEDIWDNTQYGTIAGASVKTITLNSSSDSSSTGATNETGTSLTDLLLGFTNVPSFSISDPITVSSGVRTTTASLELDYTTLRDTPGNLYIINGTGSVVSDSLTYIVVPEPHTWELVGLAGLTIPLLLRRRKISPSRR